MADKMLDPRPVGVVGDGQSDTGGSPPAAQAVVGDGRPGSGGLPPAPQRVVAAGEQEFAPVSNPNWLAPDETHGLWRTEVALRIRDLWHRLREASALEAARHASMTVSNHNGRVFTVSVHERAMSVIVRMPHAHDASPLARDAAWSSHMQAARLALNVADGAIRVPQNYSAARGRSSRSGAWEPR